jgi:hypothetical protein
MSTPTKRSRRRRGSDRSLKLVSTAGRAGARVRGLPYAPRRRSRPPFYRSQRTRQAGDLPRGVDAKSASPPHPHARAALGAVKEHDGAASPCGRRARAPRLREARRSRPASQADAVVSGHEVRRSSPSARRSGSAAITRTRVERAACLGEAGSPGRSGTDDNRQTARPKWHSLEAMMPSRSVMQMAM